MLLNSEHQKILDTIWSRLQAVIRKRVGHPISQIELDDMCLAILEEEIRDLELVQAATDGE